MGSSLFASTRPAPSAGLFLATLHIVPYYRICFCFGKEKLMHRITREEAHAFMKKHHYLGDVPATASLCYSNGRSVAAYGPIHAPRMPKNYLELRRLASDGSDILSRFLSATLKALKAEGVPAVLTWADPAAGHHGGIYQATNWIYTEPRSYSWNSHYRKPDGTIIDHRAAYKLFGSSAKKVVLAAEPTWETFLPPMKYRYLMPLNVRAAEAIQATNSLLRPYPKPDSMDRPTRYSSAQRYETTGTK